MRCATVCCETSGAAPADRCLPKSPRPFRKYDYDRPRRVLRPGTTPRLTLRPFAPGDVDDMFRVRQGPGVGGVPARLSAPAVHPPGRGQVRRRPDARPEAPALVEYRARRRRHWRHHPEHRLQARDRHYPLRPGARSHWGRGLMTEAARSRSSIGDSRIGGDWPGSRPTPTCATGGPGG